MISMDENSASSKERLRIIAISQYPPVEGIPTADGPINFALAKYARNMNLDILWVYARKPRFRPHWREQLNELEVRTVQARATARTYLQSIARAVRLSFITLHPRRVLLAAKEFGIIRAGTSAALQQFKPDLVFLSSPYSALVNPKLKDIPTVYNSMDSLTFSISNGLYGREEGLKATIRKWLIHRFDRYACAGHALTVFVSERDARVSPYVDRFVVIANGADVDRFPPSEKSEKADVPTLIFQGSRQYPPNRAAIDLIVREIAPQIWKYEPRAVFRFVGSSLETTESSDKRLQFVGYVEDLGKELRRAWLALAPIEDGSGMKNKVLDAASSGLPVVGLREAFNGIGPFLGGTIASDPKELVEVARKLLENPDEAYRMGLEARRFAQSLSWENQVSCYGSAFRSVADRDQHMQYRHLR